MSQYYDVEEIVGLRYNKRKRQWMYQIKWLGYDSSQNTWEPESNLKHLGALLEKFKEKNNFVVTPNKQSTIPDNQYSEPNLNKKIVIDKNLVHIHTDFKQRKKPSLKLASKITEKSHYLTNFEASKVQLDQLISIEFYNFLKKFKSRSQKRQKKYQIMEDQKYPESTINQLKESGTTENIVILKKTGDELIILSDKE